MLIVKAFDETGTKSKLSLEMFPIVMLWTSVV